ncbi:MAG: ribonuclease P protein component [Clostridia bacterium]|nr:ribonuclease P protein component [Clostridia bacterium]
MKKTKMLKKNYEFRKVLTKGKYFSGKYIECFILNNNTKCNYLGLAISTKVGKAIMRNHLKRLIRENYKNVEMSIKDGYSIVFLFKKKADSKQANFYNIREDINTIINKSQLNRKNI